MIVAIGADHAGFKLKENLLDYFPVDKVIDVGTHSIKACDYPDYAHEVVLALKNNIANFGILICASANGMSIVANKFNHIRAAICFNEVQARLARAHNDANVLCLPALFITDLIARNICDVFLNTKFENGRHKRRLEKIKSKL
jgi:ribose 5-phosphate isomerase B